MTGCRRNQSRGPRYRPLCHLNCVPPNSSNIPLISGAGRGGSSSTVYLALPTRHGPRVGMDRNVVWLHSARPLTSRFHPATAWEQVEVGPPKSKPTARSSLLGLVVHHPHHLGVQVRRGDTNILRKPVSVSSHSPNHWGHEQLFAEGTKEGTRHDSEGGDRQVAGEELI